MERILIADSSEQNSDLIRQCLVNMGYEVLISETGASAMAKAKLFHPDVIILDSELPDISAYDVCLKLKSAPDTRFTLILFVTSLETKDSRLRALESGADDFIEKNFDATILISKIRSILRVKHLSDQLKQKYTELEDTNKLLNFQMKMARSVQRSMLPDVCLTFNGVSFISRYLPALDIGGDFYDVIPLDDYRVSVVIGDVSGHGISAALLTAMLKTMIQNLVVKYYNPDQLLFYLNQAFFNAFNATNLEVYACVFYAVINTRESRIHFANAGAPYPIFVNSKENLAIELESTGTPVGMMKDSLYEYHDLQYVKDDLLLFSTDGLSDTFYKNNPEEFSQKIKDMLLDAKSLPNLNETVDIMLSSFYDYQAAESKKFELDDVSIILCRM